MRSSARKIISLLFILFIGMAITAAPLAEAEAARKHRSGSQAYLKKNKSSASRKARTEERYAALVLDSKSGVELHSVNADARRYPASLTKMMTLYLTFDALKKQKWTLETRLPVSANAASQPPTNISLKRGDRLKVRDAIQSLVVRSANDSAVVLAEALGGTESRFATMMTQKARELGMKNTMFRNASGLPDPQQISTARDMATLGMALKRDFPEYYAFFQTKSFTYNGRTYSTHNRVMTRYKGADGIKTGYINASGFNLVTSASRYGFDLVGVVMGGTSAATRDSEMIRLLDSGFLQMAEAKRTGRTFASHTPVPAVKPAEIATASTAPEADLLIGQGDYGMNYSASAADVAIPSPNPRRGGFELASDTVLTGNASALIQDRGWGIQVGAFRDHQQALLTANRLRDIARDELAQARMNITGTDKPRSAIHRARMVSLTETEARSACRKLSQMNESCFVYRTVEGRAL